MTTKTRHCEECWHMDRRIEALDANAVCKLKHKPRFYQPARIMDNNWGWKRRCEDFKERENGHPARHD